MRCLGLATLLAAGCFQSTEGGVASVQLYNQEGAPLGHWPVMFHGADGKERAIVYTTDAGLAIGPMEPDGMVTYRSPFPENQLITRGGIQRDERVIDGIPPEWVDPEFYSVVVRTPDTLDAAGLCQIEVVCGDRTVGARGVPGAEITVEVPKRCLDSTKRSLYVLVTATDHIYQVIAYAAFPAVALTTDGVARLEVTAWRTDFVDDRATIVGLDPDLSRYSFDAEAFVGSAPVSYVGIDGDGPATDVTIPIHLPAGLPGASHYRFRALFATGQLIIEQDVPPGTPFTVGPLDLLPRMTTMALSDTKVTFSTERSIHEPVRIGAVMVAADASWRLVDMPGPPVELPDLRVTEFPFLPYFSIDDLTLKSVAATTRTTHDYGDTVLTTAMPYFDP
jgi:hypothetical protein